MKMNFERLLHQDSFQKPTIAIRINLLQVYPFVPFFVFAVLFITAFNVFLRSIWWQLPT